MTENRFVGYFQCGFVSEAVTSGGNWLVPLINNTHKTKDRVTQTPLNRHRYWTEQVSEWLLSKAKWATHLLGVW